MGTIQSSKDKATTTQNMYESAVRESIRFGGDSASRSILVGACLAALSGNYYPSEEWMNKFGDERKKELVYLANSLSSIDTSN